MWKYAVLLSYVGTRFCGWQKQKGSAADGAPSIQETIEKALSQITSEEVSIVGSGRTDAGVHAIGQVAHFRLSKKQWDPRILQRGLNSALPQVIRALAVQPVAMDFHAQRSAEKKQYSYFFQQGPCPIPHLTPHSWWIHKPLNVAAMQEALDLLKGEHDFKPFQSSGAVVTTTVREILEAEVTRERPMFPGVAYPSVEFVRVRVVGTGFLKQMVRGIAGTLLQVGEERRPASDVQRILSSGDRSLVGPTAPARALWLERVWYGPDHRLFSDLFS
jgi:tRNA pseudouridine38-40 synthase